MGNSKASDLNSKNRYSKNRFSSEQLEQILFQEMALDTSALFFVGFSGGMDSTVLLHALTQLKLNITALHVDHGLQVDSGQWYQHCEKQCQQWGVPFDGVHLKVQRDKKIGLEASARNARYAWFKQKLPANAYLLTAHHQRDQAETLLFNMLRGSGVNGMSAMPKRRSIDSMQLLRPLLDVPYLALRKYADEQQLSWVEDPSNKQIEFSRNKIRHTILPALEDFREDAIAMISRTATNIMDSKVLLDEIIVNDLSHLQQKEFNPLDYSVGLQLQGLVDYSKTRIRHILRYWLEKKCGIVASRQLIQQLCDWVYAAPGSTAILQEAGQQYRCFDGVLYTMPALDEKPRLKEHRWLDINQPLRIDELGIRLFIKEGLPKKELQKFERINIVFRDEKLLLSQNGKVIKLKDLMMQRKIPPWLRYRTPLLVSAIPKDEKSVLHDLIENNQNSFCLIEKID